MVITNALRQPGPLGDPGASRIDRALTETIAVEFHGPGIYDVTGESGEPHVVDLWTVGCTCPDFTFNQQCCKHICRVIFETGQLPPFHALDDIDDADDAGQEQAA